MKRKEFFEFMDEFLSEEKDLKTQNKIIDVIQDNVWIFKHIDKNMIKFLCFLDYFMCNSSLREKAEAVKEIERKNWLEMYKEHINDNALYCEHCHEIYPRSHWESEYKKEEVWEKCAYGNFYNKAKYFCMYLICPNCNEKMLVSKTFIGRSKDYPEWALKQMSKTKIEKIETEKQY